MKCDDDSFINVPNLLHVLNGGTLPVLNATIPFFGRNTINAKSPKNRLTDNKNLLLGFMFCEAKPINDPQSKW
jgi:beta-1,3-galactosyltransferase 1